MSQRQIPVKEPDKYWGMAGYDPPLQTFFATIWLVEDQADSEIEPVIFSAGDVSRIDTPEDLEDAIAQYATIPPKIKDQLRQDKALARPPSQYQKATISMYRWLWPEG